MALDFPSNPVNGQVYDNFIYDAAKGTWKSLSSGASPNFLVSPTITNAVITATAPTPSTVPITVNGAASQSANLQEWKNSSGIDRMKIDASGNLTATGYIATTKIDNVEASGTSVIDFPTTNGALVTTNLGSAVGLRVRNTKGGFSADLQQWQNESGTNLARLDSVGRMFLPNNPYFLAYSSGGGTVTYNANDVVRFDVIRRQVGSNYNASNYRFTAPVSGNYFLWFTAFNVGGTQRVSLRINGGSGVFGQGGSVNSVDYHQAGVTYMAAGDFAEVRVAYNSTSLFLSDNHSEFGGLLLG